MAIAYVQKTTLGATGSGTAQSTGAFGANPTVGNYLVVWAWGWGSVTTSSGNVTCADNITGNTYNQVGFQSVANDLWACLFWCKTATTGASFAPRVTSTAISGSICVCAAEFSGVIAASPVDGAAVGTTGTTGAPAPGSLAFTAGDMVAAVMSNDTSGTATVTTPTGFASAQKQTNGSIQVGDGAYAAAPTTAAPTSPTNPTWNSGSAKWAAAQVALKPAATSFDPATFLAPTFDPPPRAPWRAVPY